MFGGAAGPSPLASILGQLLTQRNPTNEPSAATTSGGGSPNAQDQNNALDDNPLMSFLNQLLANLNADGARIHVQFGEAGPGHVFQPMHGSWGDYAWGDSGFDQIVTQLLNQFEGQNAQTVRPEDLQRIPMAEVTDEQVSNGAQCTTCMEAFQAKEQVAKLDCNHIFHRPCVEPWLRRNNTCPICRQAVDPSKWPPAPKQPVVSDIDELD
ncbi:zinc finger protein [Aphelenchoides avenae]|nr:zinc finger protein [Aphelenchus avenae]